MSSIKKKQEETVASIDAAKAIIDKVVAIMGIAADSSSFSVTFSTNPIGFLMQLLKSLGAKREDIEFWITKFLIFVLPTVELSAKAILLTNLKNMISCSADPRIPEKYRKQHKAPSDPNTSQEYGIDINIESIDFIDKLSINPLSDFGSNWYFGIENVEDSYKFARADDMDAFLWFVIHKGKFPNSSKITDISNLTDVNHNAANQVSPSDGSLLSALEVTYNSDNASSILLGNTFTYEGSPHVISMCIDRKYDENNNVVQNTLVPVSDDWSSVNWYVRNAYELGKNIGFGWGVDKNTKLTRYKKGKQRDFSKERAICNIQYIDQASSDSPLTGLVNNKFRFTILPKPYTHIPVLKQGEPPWRFKKMLFNANGEYDKNGKYTFAVIPTETSDNGKIIFNGVGTTVAMDAKSGKITVANPKELVKNLMECYPGLTVYEFNYDYVMGIKLFDAKVIAHSLMETLLNIHVGVGANFNNTYRESTEKVKEIIKNILESDDAEINDCYYTFDNSKYDLLLKKAEEKRAKQQKFGNVTHEIGTFDSVSEILNEYDANSEYHKQEDVLHRAITQAAVTISDGVDEIDKNSVEFNFVCDLVEALTTAIVNSILSPKLLMLLEINQKIMGGTWEKFTLSDLLKSLDNVIKAVVNEIRDLIVQELLKLVLSKLEPIIQTIGSLLLREQIDNYTEAILDIIRNCPSIWFSFGNKYQDTKLDTVDYADIDVSYTKQGEQPSINNC